MEAGEAAVEAWWTLAHPADGIQGTEARGWEARRPWLALGCNRGRATVVDGDRCCDGVAGDAELGGVGAW